MTRDKPLYDNCQLLAPDGQVLCSCNLKKAQWYLDKSLGVLVQDDPLIVRLNFEPEGRPILDGQYYIHNKDNRCVVCKSTKSLLRKNIVPHEYRRHFPGILKSHSSHDVVILCVDCHIRSNFMDAKLRQQLALQCNAPIGSHET
ncbi:EXD2 (predicted) [Pycnogonum litorale]